ncbi:hypothetical protein MTO96_007012 [Rhipicephalus appendiculatus]
MQDVCHLPNCSRVPSMNVSVVTRLFGERSCQRVVCGIFLFNASIVQQSIRGRVKKHCGCIVLVCSRCMCTLSCHVVFFCCFEVSGCVSCQIYGLFLLLIFRRAHSKETP